MKNYPIEKDNGWENYKMRPMVKEKFCRVCKSLIHFEDKFRCYSIQNDVFRGNDDIEYECKFCYYDRKNKNK